jgi:hypothetical protein
MGLLLSATAVGAAPAQPPVGAASPEHAAVSRIPPRAADAVGGTEFARRIAGLEEAERGAAIVAEVTGGNIPEFLRRLQPVRLTGSSGSRRLSATVWVMPDYLAVGSDEDFVRVPVDFNSAVAIARAFGMALPTRKIVDAVYRQAAVRLRPQPMTPGPRMTTTSYFVTHNRRIEQQRGGRRLGVLVAGQKKDLVLTNQLYRRGSARVAIYGWHEAIGKPIQPLSTVHRASYADYSHGLRLVHGMMLVDGVETSVFDVLDDPARARLLSLEGAIRVPAAMVSDESSPAPVRPAAR